MVMMMTLTPFLTGCDRGPSLHPSGPCPPTNIIRGLAKQTLRDPNSGEVIARVEIDALRTLCETNDRHADLTIETRFSIFRKTEKDTIPFVYFVAVTNAGGELLAKQEIPLEASFDKRERKVNVTDYVEKLLPLTPEGDVNTYRVYVGLQMDAREWEKNKVRYR